MNAKTGKVRDGRGKVHFTRTPKPPPAKRVPKATPEGARRFDCPHCGAHESLVFPSDKRPI